MFVPMIGQRIKQFREKKNLSQRKLAKLAGLSPSHLQHIEDGSIRNPGLATLTSICDVLGVSRERFFAKEDA